MLSTGFFWTNVYISIKNNIKMIYYERIDISEGIDVHKTSALKECHVCHYWYFLNFSFKLQLNICKMSAIDVIVY